MSDQRNTYLHSRIESDAKWRWELCRQKDPALQSESEMSNLIKSLIWEDSHHRIMSWEFETDPYDIRNYAYGDHPTDLSVYFALHLYEQNPTKSNRDELIKIRVARYRWSVHALFMTPFSSVCMITDNQPATEEK